MLTEPQNPGHRKFFPERCHGCPRQGQQLFERIASILIMTFLGTNSNAIGLGHCDGDIRSKFILFVLPAFADVGALQFEWCILEFLTTLR